MVKVFRTRKYMLSSVNQFTQAWAWLSIYTITCVYTHSALMCSILTSYMHILATTTNYHKSVYGRFPMYYKYNVKVTLGTCIYGYMQIHYCNMHIVGDTDNMHNCTYRHMAYEPKQFMDVYVQTSSVKSHWRAKTRKCWLVLHNTRCVWNIHHCVTV